MLIWCMSKLVDGHVEGLFYTVLYFCICLKVSIINLFLKNKKLGQAWWLMSVIPAPWKAKVGGS